VAIDGLGGHLIKNMNVLAGEQGCIHEEKRAVGADDIGGRLQVNGLALGQAAADG
jgi:hypothetical protein